MPRSSRINKKKMLKRRMKVLKPTKMVVIFKTNQKQKKKKSTKMKLNLKANLIQMRQMKIMLLLSTRSLKVEAIAHLKCRKNKRKHIMNLHKMLMFKNLLKNMILSQLKVMKRKKEAKSQKMLQKRTDLKRKSYQELQTKLK